MNEHESAMDERQRPVVCTYNEWDPVEEVVVGVIDGAAVPEWHVTLESTMPKGQWDYFRRNGGKPFPQDQIDAAKRDLDGFVRLLEREGITVRRPDVRDHTRPFATPDWRSASGLYAAMPRDALLVIGDELIEAPMAWRSRAFEVNAYRSLLKEYFRAGARWTSVPRPELLDESFDATWEDPGENGDPAYCITEFEPTFDAADFLRFGRDIVVQRSNVTNAFGIEWLRRHLAPHYRVHEVAVNDSHPMHIDATLMPLAPGKLLANPERLPNPPALFKDWEVLYAPPPTMPDSHLLYMTSKWLNVNVFSLDEKRVVVEAHEEPTIEALRKWGFDPIPCSFRNFNTFGGSFHCATLDTRRRGELRSYF